MKMEQTWLGKAEARGRAEGRAEAVEHVRRMVLRRIQKRFGAVPEAVEARVQAMNSINALAGLLEKLLVVPSAEALLSRRSGRRAPTRG